MTDTKDRVPYGKGRGTPRNQPTPKKIKDLLEKHLPELFPVMTTSNIGVSSPVVPGTYSSLEALHARHGEFLIDLMAMLNVRVVMTEEGPRLTGAKKAGRPMGYRPASKTGTESKEDPVSNFGLDEDDLDGLSGSFGGR